MLGIDTPDKLWQQQIPPGQMNFLFDGPKNPKIYASFEPSQDSAMTPQTRYPKERSWISSEASSTDQAISVMLQFLLFAVVSANKLMVRFLKKMLL